MTLPNVLLIILDSVRASNTSLHGHNRETTPFLQQYADRATKYSQARAPGIHSVASHASMWTGTHVEEHGATEHSDQLRPGTTVWEELSEDGYETGIFTENAVVAQASNLSECFETRVTTDQYVDKQHKLFEDAHSPSDEKRHEGFEGNLKRCYEDDATIKSLLNCGYHYYLKRKDRNTDGAMTTPELVNRFLDWESETDGPWAACLNLMDAHYPYEPESEYDQWGGEELRSIHARDSGPQSRAFLGDRPMWQLGAFESLYDGAILQLGAYIEDLVNELENRGVHEETLVVITSDHGEGFGETSRLTGRTPMIDHSWGIHEVLTHVPLVVKYPGQTDGQVITEPASLTQFPDAVRETRSEAPGRDSFVPEGPVLSSTFRLSSDDAERFADLDVDVEDFTGPWRAVYEESDGSVLKYAQKSEQGVVLEIIDSQNIRVHSRDSALTVSSAFEELEPAGILRGGDEVLDDGVEDRLAELGYLT